MTYLLLSVYSPFSYRAGRICIIQYIKPYDTIPYQGVHLGFKANYPGGLLGLPDPTAHNNFQ